MSNGVKIKLAVEGGAQVDSALNSVTGRMEKMGQAAKEVGATTANAMGKTRAGVVSISQQLDAAKDSLKAMAQAAVGLASIGALVGMAKEAFALSITMERVSNTLKFASGDAASFAANSAFLQSTVRALGLDLQSASQQFASLSAAARGTTLEGAGARSIFDAVAKASTVMGLTADQTAGSLNAISQMISKGTVSAEELRGQLGERLPGAFQIAARAMGVTTAELGKLLETGSLATDVFLPRFAAQMRLEMGGSVKDAADSVQANLNRVKSDWAALVVIVNNSAFNNETLKGVDQFLLTLSGTLSKSKNDFKGWGDTVADTLAFVGDAVATTMRVVALVGDSIGAVAAQAKIHFDRVKALNELKYDYSSDREAKVKAIQDSYSAQLAAIHQGMDDKAKALREGSSALRDGLDSQRSDKVAAANDPGNIYATSRANRARIEADMALLAGKANFGSGKDKANGGKTDAQKGVELYNDLTAQSSGYTKDWAEKVGTLSAAFASGGIKNLGEFNAALAELNKQQPYAIKAAKDAQETAQWMDAYEASVRKTIAASTEEVTRAEEAYNAHGKLASVLAEEELARLDVLRTITLSAYEDTATVDAQIANKKRLIAVLKNTEVRDANEKAATKAQEVWDKTSGSIRDGLTDAFMSAAESGKNVFDSLVQSLKNQFNSLVLRPIVSAVMNPIAQGITGALGLSGVANAGGGSLLGSLGSAVGLGNFANSLTSGTGLLGSLGTAAAGFGQAAAATFSNGLIAGFGTNMANIGALASGGSFATALGAAMPYLLPLALIPAISGMFDGGHEYTVGQGITGKFSNAGFAGTNYQDWRNDGSSGFLGIGASGSSSGRNRSALDTKVTAGLNDSFKALQTQVVGFAEQLGMGTEGIKNYSRSLDIALGSDKAANEAAIANAIKLLGNELAMMADGNWGWFDIKAEEHANRDYLTALARQATALTTLNQVFKGMDKTLLSLTPKSSQYASRLADAFGSLENLTAAYSGYYEKFYTTAEKTANTTREVAKALDAVGLVMPAVGTGARDAYRALVDSQDITTDAGRKATAVLVTLSGTFDGLVTAAAALTDGLTAEVKRIRGLTGTSAQNFAGAQAAFATTTAQARTGDAEALKMLPALSQSLLTMARDNSHTLAEFTRYQNNTANSLEATANIIANKDRNANVSAFASGGDFAGGVRLVGERGPELELTGPSRIFNATQTRAMLNGGGGDTARLEALVQKQSEQLEAMRYELRSIATSNQKMAKLNDKWDVNGLPTTAAA